MAPYLEAPWGDVHATLLVYARNQLNAQLPDDLQATVEEDVTIETEEGARTIYPDVQVAEQPEMPAGESRPAVVALAEPHVVSRVAESRVRRWVEIAETGAAGRLITVIEFLRIGKTMNVAFNAAHAGRSYGLREKR